MSSNSISPAVSTSVERTPTTAVELLSPGPNEPIFNQIKGWILSFFLFFSAFLGSIFVITPLLPLVYLRPKLWRFLMDRCIGCWMIWPGLMMEVLFGVETTISGDEIDHAEPAIIIMNHRTRLDWLFFWNALYKMDPWLITSLKISMKGILKHIPGAGWAMASNAFLFLDRRFEDDKYKLDSMINYYSKSGHNYQLLLFPEGTDKCPLATERHRLYSESRHLPIYEYLLHPRTTGFLHIIKTMRDLNYIKYVYDVTIGYPTDVVQTEMDLVLYGKCPSKVHYQVRKIAIDDLPKVDIDLVNWLKQLWKEKEDKLRNYYSKPIQQRYFENGANNYEMTTTARWTIIFLLVLWIFTTFFWLSACFLVPYIFLWIVVSILIFTTIHKVYGGIEWMSRDYMR